MVNKKLKKLTSKEKPKNEEIFDENEKEYLETNKKIKSKDEKSLFSKIMNVVLWVVLILWMVIVTYDFYNVSKEKDPKFCLSTKTTKYDDGTVESCLGLGYKVHKYNRESFKAIEFGPFWTKDRTAKTE